MIKVSGRTFTALIALICYAGFVSAQVVSFDNPGSLDTAVNDLKAGNHSGFGGGHSNQNPQPFPVQPPHNGGSGHQGHGNPGPGHHGGPGPQPNPGHHGPQPNPQPNPGHHGPQPNPQPNPGHHGPQPNPQPNPGHHGPQPNPQPNPWHHGPQPNPQPNPWHHGPQPNPQPNPWYNDPQPNPWNHGPQPNPQPNWHPHHNGHPNWENNDWGHNGWNNHGPDHNNWWNNYNWWWANDSHPYSQYRTVCNLNQGAYAKGFIVENTMPFYGKATFYYYDAFNNLISAGNTANNMYRGGNGSSIFDFYQAPVRADRCFLAVTKN